MCEERVVACPTDGGEGGWLREWGELSVCAFRGDGEERRAWGGGEFVDWVHAI